MHTAITPPRELTVFRLGMGAIALNFLIPAASYVIDPTVAIGTVDRLNVLLGGGPLPPEQTHVWHMLAVGNVATLGWMCAMLWVDLRRFHPALPALLFLKAFSATYSAFIAAYQGLPAFWGIALLDGSTTLAMAWLAERALDALDQRPAVPLWMQAVLPRPRLIRANLERLAASGRDPALIPNLWQVFLGTLYMRARLLFRPGTVGTSSRPIRRTWRARVLQWRLFRIPALVWERAIAPFDLSGLALTPERLATHLVGAHHDGAQFTYDLELLSLHPGQVEALRDALRALLARGGSRLEWLRDLCVFEGYHEELLAAVEAACEGRDLVPAAQRHDPDITLAAWLSWCARQPATPRDTLAALLVGELSFRPRPVPAS